MRAIVLFVAALLFAVPASARIHRGVAASTSGDPTSNVLPSYNDAYANWSNAGLVKIGGIPNRTTQCGSTVNPSGLTPPTTGDDASLINAAIAACAAGQYVLLGSGTFNLDKSEIINLDKGISLRGTGTCNNTSSPYCSTVLQYYNGLLESWNTSGYCGTALPGTGNCSGTGTPMIFMAPVSSLYDYGWSACNHPGSVGTCTGTALGADAAQGQTTIQVAQTSSFSVGMWVLIDEAMASTQQTNPVTACGDQVWAAPDALSASGSPATGRFIWPTSSCTSNNGGSPPTSFSAFLCSAGYSYCDRPNEELHLISAIGAGPCPGTNCTLTFDDPLTDAFRISNSHAAQVYYPSHQLSSTVLPFLQQAGVENLTITRVQNGGINMLFCAYCWVKNVEVVGWADGAVNMTYTARSQITGSYLHLGWDLENSGAEYIFSLNNAATENLVDNNILVLGGKGMVGRTGAANVIAYNYQDDQMYMASSIGNYWEDVGTAGSHWTGSHHYLFEGNWASNCDNDDTWGSDIYMTYFRNWCTGIRTPFTDPSNSWAVDDTTGHCYQTGGSNPHQCAPARSAGLMAWEYWNAYVGNVLGWSGVTTSGNSWVYSANDWAGGQKGAIWLLGWNSIQNSKTDSNLTGASPWLFRHGDYDYYNTSIQDWTTGYSHTLPNSFYLSSAPSYFSVGCTSPWPWVTSTSGTPIASNACGGSGLPAQARYNAGTPFVQPSLGAIMFQHIASSTNPVGIGISGRNFAFNTESLPANTVAVLGVTAPVGKTVTISDTLVGSWSANVCGASGGSGNFEAWVFVQPLGATGGTDTITINVGSSNTLPVQFDLTLWENINTTSPVNGHLCTGAITPASGGVVGPGSFTPTNNNSNGGNVVWNYTALAGAQGAKNPTSWVPATNFSLLNGDIIWTTNQGFPEASQYYTQATAASVTPSITATGDTTNAYNSATVALAVASNGATAPSSIHVGVIGHESFATFASPGTMKIQVPWIGNLRVLTFSWQGDSTGGGSGYVSAISSSDGCNFTEAAGMHAAGGASIWYAQGCSPCPTCTASLTWTGTYTSPQGSFRYYDVQNAASSSYQNDVTDGQVSCGTSVTDAPTFTPTGATSGLTIQVTGNGNGPITGFASGAPSGAVFDLWTFTGQTDSDVADNADSSDHLYYSSKATQNWNFNKTNGGDICYPAAAAFN